MVKTLADTEKETHFTFLTNHALVVILLGGNNRMRMRDLAEQIGITERAVQRIVDELVSAGYVSVIKSGRRNVYTLNPEKTLRHPIMKNQNLADLLKLGPPHETEDEFSPIEHEHEIVDENQGLA